MPGAGKIQVLLFGIFWNVFRFMAELTDNKLTDTEGLLYSVTILLQTNICILKKLREKIKNFLKYLLTYLLFLVYFVLAFRSKLPSVTFPSA